MLPVKSAPQRSRTRTDIRQSPKLPSFNLHVTVVTLYRKPLHRGHEEPGPKPGTGHSFPIFAIRNNWELSILSRVLRVTVEGSWPPLHRTGKPRVSSMRLPGRSSFPRW